MSRARNLIAVTLFAAFAAGAAQADPPHCPPGHAKKGWCDARQDRDWRDERRAYEDGYRDGQRQARWELNRRLPRDVDYIVVRDYDRYDLGPPPRGHYYAEVDGDILLIQAATQLVLQALR